MINYNNSLLFNMCKKEEEAALEYLYVRGLIQSQMPVVTPHNSGHEAA